jgi:hypothetical protein
VAALVEVLRSDFAAYDARRRSTLLNPIGGAAALDRQSVPYPPFHAAAQNADIAKPGLAEQCRSIGGAFFGAANNNDRLILVGVNLDQSVGQVAKRNIQRGFNMPQGGR